MSGTSTGSIKAVKTIKKLYGKAYFERIGAIGGLRKVPKGFALSGKASEAGKLGGQISKRRPKNPLTEPRWGYKPSKWRFWE